MRGSNNSKEGSTLGNISVQPSEDDSSKGIMRSLLENASCLTPPNHRIVRFELKTITMFHGSWPNGCPNGFT